MQRQKKYEKMQKVEEEEEMQKEVGMEKMLANLWQMPRYPN